MQSFYKPGSWNATCDVCGFVFKADALKKRWDNLMVCDADYELRNPQDFIKIPKEDSVPPWTRPAEDMSQYVVCNFANSVGIAGVGVAGCLHTGRATIFG